MFENKMKKIFTGVFFCPLGSYKTNGNFGILKGLTFNTVLIYFFLHLSTRKNPSNKKLIFKLKEPFFVYRLLSYFRILNGGIVGNFSYASK
jgi:hypothetical protein